MPTILSLSSPAAKLEAGTLLEAKIAEKAVETTNLKLDKDIIDYLYKVKLSLLNFFNQYKRLDFNLKFYSNKKLIDKLPEEGYFKMKRYNFVNIGGFTKSKDTNAKRLLQKLHSHTFKVFHFGNEFNPLEAKPFSFYKKEVMRVLPKVSLEACISGCVITQRDFMHIIHSSSNCKALKFKNCVIETDNISLSKSIKFKTNLVEFDNCKTHSPENGLQNLLQVQDFLQAVLGCSLAKSLMTFKVSNCGTTRESFPALAQELNRNGIKIYDDGNDN
eukprot:CAMPEP_0197005074 /NCGR_PEP_ID=MMETSP1380-20130617/27517_1 /TAXON_ID=5936 /ORGANISM="Euplotes crassus, Strain CT5" /LENGTH=273 /DNA_ID=CAMNT_0042424075 /DNA_START=38 /DNA_END=859 /DNA_ORIENTATION=+